MTIALSALIRPPQALRISSKDSVFRFICIRSECKLISISNIFPPSKLGLFGMSSVDKGALKNTDFAVPI